MYIYICTYYIDYITYIYYITIYIYYITYILLLIYIYIIYIYICIRCCGMLSLNSITISPFFAVWVHLDSLSAGYMNCWWPRRYNPFCLGINTLTWEVPSQNKIPGGRCPSPWIQLLFDEVFGLWCRSLRSFQDVFGPLGHVFVYYMFNIIYNICVYLYIYICMF